MSTYCEGSDCSKRGKCKLHNPGEGTHEYIDWSTYGSGTFKRDKNGKYEAIIEHSCGDKGEFKRFEPIPCSSKETLLIDDINKLFHESLSKILKPVDIQIVELLVKQEGTLLNELWNNIIETIKKHDVK